MTKPFGEIVESTLTTFKSQCWQWDNVPPFGSILVTTNESIQIFGITAHIQTGSNDPGRYPYAYQKTEEELKKEQPQIFALLQTVVSSVIIGYRKHEDSYYQLPEHTPKIHSFVRPATTEEIQSFFANPLYLHVLFGNATLPVSNDELLLGLLTQLFAANAITESHLYEFIHTYSALSKSDYRRLKLFCQRVQTLVDKSPLREINIAIEPSSLSQQEL